MDIFWRKAVRVLQSDTIFLSIRKKAGVRHSKTGQIEATRLEIRDFAGKSGWLPPWNSRGRRMFGT
jgi:hypothetical protein